MVIHGINSVALYTVEIKIGISSCMFASLSLLEVFMANAFC